MTYTDLEELIELIRSVADDTTTTYKPRRTLSAAKSYQDYRQRRARRAANAVESKSCCAPAPDVA